jgi:peptidoglycan hydrolase-like protein with peptidoglycan-binding domain
VADDMVLHAQRFVNRIYGTRIGMTVEEDGRTGWNTMYALTRALQWELGISPLSNSFGPTTLSTLASRFPRLNQDTVPSADFCRIIQSAMYCKGYDGGGVDGIYNSRVQEGITKLKADMGVAGSFPGSDLTPKVFKGLLNMDAYVVVNSGSDAIRNAQQWLNGRYVNRRDFFIIPCDGHNSRDVAKSMLLAIQYELGMADGVANGVFGPGTQSGLRSHPVSSGSSGIWVSLFSAAMILNKRPVSFSSSFGSALADAVRAFQSFAKLAVNGSGDFPTWASLLVSHGDQSRKGEACDGVTKITPARAATLRAEGIRYVGRYLTSVSTTSLPEKVIQPGELQTIADNGLRCFPIYQTYGRDASGFNYAAGRAAGYAAMNAAMDHGFKNGTRIFFAVDFDALDHEVTSNILPHFKGIEDSMADAGNPFPVGVYGPRNVCTRVAEAGHSSASFVADMSSGFSGNYGYPLPADWAYDQIVTRTIGTGDGRIEIDNNIASGRDIGQNSFNPARGVIPDKALHASLHASLQLDVGKYMESIGFPNDGGVRTYQHWKCFQTTVLDHDDLITRLSNRYNMRKALIQTSAYWEMRHIGIEDETQDLRVEAYHNGLPGGVRDSSTGIAQITGNAAVIAWNHAISRGYESGTVRDPDNDGDLYHMWRQVKDEEFALRTVALIHLWGADGKPGGNNPPGGETTLRSMRLDYTENEIFQVLRRYQGWGDEAELHAGRRMALYHIYEKYNGIARHF